MRREAFAIASLLLIAPVALAVEDGNAVYEECDLYTPPHDHGPADGHAHNHTGGGTSDPCTQTGTHRPIFEPVATFDPPTYEDAKAFPVYSTITIEGPDGFAQPSFSGAGLVIPGSGTPQDPYVLEKLKITSSLRITDTDDCFVLRDLYFSHYLDPESNGYVPDLDGSDWTKQEAFRIYNSVLYLNWNGPCAHVHSNHVNDLRVNQNVERTGYATGGVIEKNRVEFVGQLRHYDGIFRENIVGVPDRYVEPGDYAPVLDDWDVLTYNPTGRIVNVDGFNQGILTGNTFYGGVDLDFHGHHHGAGFFARHSHYHGDNQTIRIQDAHDHTERWTSVAFTGNTIIDPYGYGLLYEDSNHAGDDRTAASESEPTLDEPHRHQTHVTIADNTLAESQIRVNIFNADRTNFHPYRNDGWLDITGNTVTLEKTDPTDRTWNRYWSPLDSAILVQTAKEVDLRIAGNTLVLQDEVPDRAFGLLNYPWRFTGRAIELIGFRDADITIEDNAIQGPWECAVYANNFDEATTWRAPFNDFAAAEHELCFDDQVPQPE